LAAWAFLPAPEWAICMWAHKRLRLVPHQAMFGRALMRRQQYHLRIRPGQCR
jgi:hypothetical protein